MLEQRRAKEKGYITLKEAAQISNYSPDYIGQLIRSGKIRGEQVYSNVAWVTTEDEVLAYMQNKSRTVQESQNNYEALAQRVFSYALYGVIVFFVLVLLMLQYIFYVTFDDSLTDRQLSSAISEDRL